MRRVFAAVALLAFAATAMGQLDFPYASCSRPLRRSTYSVSPVATFPSANTVCWTIKYSAAQCTESNSCCDSDVHKMELDVKPSCAAGFKASATINGKGTTAPLIKRPPNAADTEATLYITGLTLDSTNADGSVLCLTIEKGSCMTLSTLAVSPIWSVALYDNTHKCCPVSRGGSPPPPSPPPPSPPPPPPPSPPPPPPPRPPPPSPPPPSPPPPPPPSPPPPPPPRPPPPSPPPPSPPPPPPPLPPPPSPPPPSPPPPSPPPPPPPSPPPPPPPSPPPPPPPRPPPPSPPPPSPPPPSPPPPPPPSPPPPPPPRPPPPSPPPPSPPPPCSTCLIWEVLGDLPFFDDADNCALASARVMEGVNYYKAKPHVIVSGFAAPVCSGNQIKVCGGLWSKEAGQAMAAEMTAAGAGFIVTPIFGFDSDVCPISLAGYSIRMRSDNGVCAPLEIAGPACAPPTTPFPFCVCSKAAGVTPFQVGRDIAVTQGVSTNTYCLSINTVTPSGNSKCAQQTVMKKAEFFFDYSKRFQLTSISIQYKDGTTVSKSKSWGPVGDNTLKVSDLNWSVADVKAKAPKICFELKKTTAIEDFSMDPSGYVWASLFDPAQNCCPTYYSVA